MCVCMCACVRACVCVCVCVCVCECVCDLISSHLGFVHPLQDVALHQCLPSSSVCCLPNPGGSLLLCYVILPSSAWSSSRPPPSPWLPLCASPCPPIVCDHVCEMSAISVHSETDKGGKIRLYRENKGRWKRQDWKTSLTKLPNKQTHAENNSALAPISFQQDKLFPFADRPLHITLDH